jgi:hypothetical protein
VPRLVGGADVDEALLRLDDWLIEHQRVTRLVIAKAESRKGANDDRPAPDR